MTKRPWHLSSFFVPQDLPFSKTTQQPQQPPFFAQTFQAKKAGRLLTNAKEAQGT